MGRRQVAESKDEVMNEKQLNDDSSFHSLDEDQQEAPAKVDDSPEDSFHTAEEDSEVGKDQTRNTPAPLSLRVLRTAEANRQQSMSNALSSTSASTMLKKNPQHTIKLQRDASTSSGQSSNQKAARSNSHMTFGPGKSSIVRTGRVHKPRRPGPVGNILSGRDAILHQRLIAASHLNPDVRPPSTRQSRARKGR